MELISNTIHFDVDEQLLNYLTGTMRSYALRDDNIDLIQKEESFAVASIKSYSQITDTLLSHIPHLKLVITRTVGTDHIDLQACKSKGIAVYHIPDYGSHNIAEHAFGLLLAGARHIVSAHKAAEAGLFTHKPFLGLSLKGKTMGVLGTGRIGMEFIARARCFGLRVLAFDSYCNVEKGKKLGYECVDLRSVLTQSDFISIHLPLNPDTHHMISHKQVQMMKDGVILVNTARGAIVDTDALISHINKFSCLCLDVLEDEKMFRKDHPLLNYSNVIITPHIGFFTDESVQSIAKQTEECIQRFEKGDDTNRLV